MTNIILYIEAFFMDLFKRKQSKEIHGIKNKVNSQTNLRIAKSERLNKEIQNSSIYKIGVTERIAQATSRRI